MSEEVARVAGDRLRVSPADIRRFGAESAVVLSVLRYGAGDEGEFEVLEGGWTMVPDSTWMRLTGFDRVTLRSRLYRMHLEDIIEFKAIQGRTGYRLKFAGPGSKVGVEVVVRAGDDDTHEIQIPVPKIRRDEGVSGA